MRVADRNGKLDKNVLVPEAALLEAELTLAPMLWSVVAVAVTYLSVVNLPSL
jgi:hypothetical protein